MNSTNTTPPILTARSLELTTKVVAIYCAFYLVTVGFNVFVNATSETGNMSQEYVLPMYLVAGVHLIILLITLFSILKKRFSWFLTIITICIVLASRIWFEEFAIWVNGL